MKVRPTRALELRDNGSSRERSEFNSAGDSSFAARVEGSSVLIAIPRPQRTHRDTKTAAGLVNCHAEFETGRRIRRHAMRPVDPIRGSSFDSGNSGHRSSPTSSLASAN